MKKLALLLAATATLAGCATIETVNTSQEQVAKVYAVPSANKLKIYSTSKQWIAENFRSAKAVLEYDSKDEGTIIGNGSIAYPCDSAMALDCMAKAGWTVQFTMRMDIKDERFRLNFTNISLAWPGYAGQAVMVKSDFERASVQLLDLGDKIAANVGAQDKKQDW